MLRNRLMAGLAVLALLGTIAGCGGDTGESSGAANTFTLEGYVTVDAYHYDEATGTYVHFYHHETSNTITTIGQDWIAQQLGGTPSTTSAKYISLSPDTTVTPPVSWEQLGGVTDDEITTGGLARALGDYAHTPGANTWTITETFTATAGHTDVQQAGLQWVVTPDSNGDLLAAAHFTAVTLSSADTLTVTWTLTLS